MSVREYLLNGPLGFGGAPLRIAKHPTQNLYAWYSVPSTVGDRFYKFSALRTTASAACQNCREHTQSVLVEVPSEITSHCRKIGPHHQCEVWSTLRLGADDGLEPVKRHFCVVEPKDRPVPGFFQGCTRVALGQQEACRGIARPRDRIHDTAIAKHQVIGG